MEKGFAKGHFALLSEKKSYPGSSALNGLRPLSSSLVTGLRLMRLNCRPIELPLPKLTDFSELSWLCKALILVSRLQNYSPLSRWILFIAGDDLSESSVMWQSRPHLCGHYLPLFSCHLIYLPSPPYAVILLESETLKISYVDFLAFVNLLVSKHIVVFFVRGLKPVLAN